MNTNKLHALASACRSLASDLESEAGPKLGSGAAIIGGKPCCAFGHALTRAGLSIKTGICTNMEGIQMFLGLPSTAYLGFSISHNLGNLTCANDHTHVDNRAKSVLMPLKLLADALDQEASRRLDSPSNGDNYES